MPPSDDWLYRANVARSLDWATYSHDPRSPAHGWTHLVRAIGQLDTLRRRYPDDPVLAAELVQASLPTIQGTLDALARWATEMAERTPDRQPTTGARL